MPANSINDKADQPAPPAVTEKASRLFARSATAAATIVLACAAIDLSGWVFDIAIIKHPFGTEPSLQSATAACFLLGAAATLLNARLWRQVSARLSMYLLAALILICGLLNLLEHTLQLDWSLAFPLWQPKDAMPLTFPGPMAPDVSFNFMLTGAALLLSAGAKPWRWQASQILILLNFLPNLMILFCYMFGVPHLCAYFGCVKFSAVTSSLFAILSFAILFARPGQGITGLFVADSQGSKLLRLVFMAALGMVPLLYAVKLGEINNLYDTTVTVGLMGLVIVGFVGGALAWGARKIDSIAEEKSHAVELLKQSIDTFVPKVAIPRLKRVCLQCTSEYHDTTLVHCPVDGTELKEIVDSSLEPGSLFADRYQVVEFLGAGGLATVYQAKHLLLDKRFALKLLRMHLASDANAVQRFQREARALSLLSHPNVVAVHDFGLTMDGQTYLVMDYLEGTDLNELLEREERLQWQEAVNLFIQICQGLEHAHANSIIHRDLKPSNVMLIEGADGSIQCKLVDFGLAKGTDLQGLPNLTQTGDVFGTPVYMSPEQCSAENLDCRSDIYSLGCLMYTTLNGFPPFLGQNMMDTLKKQLFDAPAAFHPDLGVPPWLESIVMKALEKKPIRRQQSAQEVLESLQAGMVATIGN